MEKASACLAHELWVHKKLTLITEVLLSSVVSDFQTNFYPGGVRNGHCSYSYLQSL